MCRYEDKKEAGAETNTKKRPEGHSFNRDALAKRTEGDGTRSRSDSVLDVGAGRAARSGEGGQVSSSKRVLACVGLALAAVTPWSEAKAPKTVLPVDAATGRIVYSGVVTIDGMDSPTLYSRALAWTAALTRDHLDPVVVGDAAQERVTLTGALELAHGRAVGSLVFHQTTIEVRSGHYEFKVTRFVFRGDGYFFKDKDRELEAVKSTSVTKSVDEAVRAMLASLESAMRAAAPPTKSGETK
jgi:hypothetical protein